MNPDDIDRALQEDPIITPSPEFTGRVMRAVRQQADERKGLAFPWRRLMWGLAACAILTVTGLVVTLLGGGPPPIAFETVVEAVARSALAPAVAWATTALVGSYALVWWSLRLAGNQQ